MPSRPLVPSNLASDASALGRRRRSRSNMLTIGRTNNEKKKMVVTEAEAMRAKGIAE